MNEDIQCDQLARKEIYAGKIQGGRLEKEGCRADSKKNIKDNNLQGDLEELRNETTKLMTTIIKEVKDLPIWRQL